MHMIFGHAGGIDEMAIFLMPVIIGLGVWILTRRQSPPDSPYRSAPREQPEELDPPDQKAPGAKSSARKSWHQA
jgi:hypothetical protein